MLTLFAASFALAVPFDLVHQGRLLDADGAPIQGEVALEVTLTDASGTTLGSPWVFTDESVDDGYFAVRLTGVDSDWFAGDVNVAISVNSAPLGAPQLLASSPRAGLSLRTAGAVQGQASGACSEAGALRWDPMASQLKVCNGHLWVSGSGGDIADVGGARGWADGTTAASCDAYIHPTDGVHTYTGATGDGVYWVDPDGAGSVGAVPLFCDMTRAGGGWTLVAKFAAGKYDGLTNNQYAALIANDIAHVNPGVLQHPGQPGRGRIATLDRAFTNALYGATPHKVARIDYVQSSATSLTPTGPFYQRRISGAAGMDFWHAMRDSRLWGSGTSSDSVVGFGTTFKLAFGDGSWNEATHDFPHQGDSHFGWWDAGTLNLPSGETLSVSRHMGLICDGYNSAGAGWLLTSNPGNGSFKNDSGHSQRSVVWLR